MSTLTLFISHSHHDSGFCHRLLAYLKEHLPNSDIFYDEEKLHGGDDWMRRIQHEVLARPLFVVILSPNAVVAEWVREETNLALREAVRNRERRIIPLRYQECDINQLAPLLQNRQIIDCAYQNEMTGFAQLVATLQEEYGVTDEAVKVQPIGDSALEQAREYAAQAHDAFAAGQWRTAARLGQFAVTMPGNERDTELWGELGISLVRSSQFTEGVAALNKALEINRYRSDLWREKAKALVKKGENIDVALVAWNHALVTAGTKEGKLDILLEDMLVALGQAGRYSDALNAAEEALEIDPRSAKAWLSKGDALRWLERYSEAIQTWDALLAIDKHNVAAWLRQGSVYDINLKRPEQALTVYDTAIAGESNAPQLWFAKGSLLVRLRRDDESKAALERALATCDSLLAATQGDYALWTVRGSILSSLNKHQEAVAAYDRALAIKPDDTAILAAKAHSLDASGSAEEALLTYDQILASDPSDYLARTDKSRRLIRLGRFGEAIKVYDDWIALAPTAFWAWKGKADTLKSVGDKELYRTHTSSGATRRYEEALEVLDHALALRSDYAPAWDHRGELLAKLKRYEEALIAFDRGLALDPRWDLTLRHKGDVLKEMERYEEALVAYEQALSIEPDYAYSWRDKAQVLEKLGRQYEALEAYNRMIKIDPRDEYVWKDKLDFLIRTNDLAGALAFCEQTIASNPSERVTQEADQEKAHVLRLLGGQDT